MNETCAVCKKGIGPAKCEICGFSDDGFINRSFPVRDDLNNWLETVVKPYRIQWEAKKKENELLAQLEEAKKREAKLLAQVNSLANKKTETTRTLPTPQQTSLSGSQTQPPSGTRRGGSGNFTKIAIAVLLGVVVLFLGVFRGWITQETFTDSRDSKKYKIVKIGNQTWMAENLNYNASGSKCYNNNSSNCDKYRGLYNLETAKKACPNGWHLPSDNEWQTLVDFAGGAKIAGKKLKAKNGWNDYEGKSGSGTDDYGFSALPGGNGGSGGSFGNVGNNGYWWSATESGASYAYFRLMVYDINYVYRGSNYKSFLFSVRCLQDKA